MLNSHQSAERAQRPAGIRLDQMAAIPTPKGELEVGRRGYQPAATPFSVGKGGARQTPCRPPQPPQRPAPSITLS